MTRILFLAAFALSLTALPAGAEAPSHAFRSSPQTLAAYDDDRLRFSCRRKVRRWLGPAKGRHTGALRIAYVEQCVANSGKLA